MGSVFFEEVIPSTHPTIVMATVAEEFLQVLLRLLFLLQRAVAATVAGASVAPAVAGGLYLRLLAGAGRRRPLLRLILGAAKSAVPAAAAPAVGS